MVTCASTTQNAHDMTVKKFITLTILLLIFLTVFCGTAQASDLKIVYPPDKSLYTQPQLRVTGVAPNSLKKVIIILKNREGTKEYTSSIYNDAFSQLIELTKGENSISINAKKKISHSVYYTDGNKVPEDYTAFVVHSKNDLTGDCAKCHLPPVNGSVEYQYVEQQLSCITDKCHANYGQKESQHGPFADRECIECHNPHGTEFKNFTFDTRAQLCFRCHDEAEVMASAGEYVHFPVAKGECLSCHEPHESNLAYHLKRDTISDLCMGCHTKTTTEYEFLHEPFESGDCNACHAPHVSEHKGLLFEGGKDLCLMCHEVRKEEFERKYVHEPVGKDCSICHDPHGSNAIAHLRTLKDKDGKYIPYKKPLTESCLNCHRKLDPQVADQIENSKVTHKPVQDGKCTECHTPHSTNFTKQLKEQLKDICFKCHPKIKKILTERLFKHGATKTNGCAQCHLVHGSNRKKLLRAQYSQEYQGKYDQKKFELCFGCHNVKTIEEKVSLSTGFRNGSKNLHFAHVNRGDKGRFCITCHETHASDQEKHIRKNLTFKKKFKITIEFTKTATGGGCVVGCHRPRKYDRDNPVKLLVK